MSTLRVNTLQDVAGTGQPAMAGAAKAWVNFNGTGTVAIRASFNVSSITDNGTGDYTVNLTSAMVDANYAVVSGANSGEQVANPTSSTQVRVSTQNSAGTLSDVLFVQAAVFR